MLFRVKFKLSSTITLSTLALSLSLLTVSNALPQPASDHDNDSKLVTAPGPMDVLHTLGMAALGLLSVDDLKFPMPPANNTDTPKAPKVPPKSSDEEESESSDSEEHSDSDSGSESVESESGGQEEPQPDSHEDDPEESELAARAFPGFVAESQSR